MSEAPGGSARAEAGGRSVDVAFLPAELQATDVAILVDVLRASSTVVAALSGGFSRVLCVGSVDEARALRTPGRLLAGEQDNRPVEGFDLGNSPADVGDGQGRELVLSTTNGTPAIMRAVEAADQVLIGALLNLEALAAAVPGEADVTVVCAGTGDRFSLDDGYTAGRIVAELKGERSDAARAAEQLALSYPDSLTALGESAHAGILRELGHAEDVAVCARESGFAVVPFVSEVSGGAAVVCASSQHEQAKREVPLASSA
jgi:2-phosphosulfolactate phosphatase